jgi:hypothetical protein
MRTTVESIRQVGRSTQGVQIMNIGPGDRVAEIATIDLSKAVGNGDGANGTNGSAGANNGDGRRSRSRRSGGSRGRR